MAKLAIITGIRGQDGYYLACHLADRGYRVLGLSRGVDASDEGWEFDPTGGGSVAIRSVAYEDPRCWDDLLDELRPDEMYHLAGVSFVPDSWADPLGTIDANLQSTVGILEAVRRRSPDTRLFYAASSEIFGRPDSERQDERTPLAPLSPYGVSKAASHCMIDVYRRKYGLFACSGILFNHESPRRPSSFVTRKISSAAAAIAAGTQSELRLGNLDSCRDWGYAGDFVDCMWRMLQAPIAKDYVVGTGRPTSIRRLLDVAFGELGLDWRHYVSVDPQLARGPEPKTPCADPRAAAADLDWHPRTSIESLMRMMVRRDVELAAPAGRVAPARRAA